MYNISTPIQLSVADLSKMVKEVNIEASTLNIWDKEDKDIATPLIKEMVKYLNPTPIIHEFDKNSVADQIIKIDLAFEFAKEVITENGETYISSPHKIIGFQVKSSEHYAEKHIEKNKDGIFYKGTYYPCPGVFWCTEIKLDILISLAKFVGADLQDYLLKALDILELLKPTAEKSPIGDWLDYRRVRRFLTNQQWNALFELKVVNLIGGKVFYL